MRSWVRVMVNDICVSIMDTRCPYLARATRSRISFHYRTCAWCGQPIVGLAFDPHHWHVKRGMVPADAFPVIDVVVNVVPLHHDCHMRYGQTRAMEARCEALVNATFGDAALRHFVDTLETWRTVRHGRIDDSGTE